MTSYRPSSSLPAEEFELTGPALAPTTSRTPRQKTLTLNPNSSSTLLFSAAPTTTHRRPRRRTSSNPIKPGAEGAEGSRVYSRSHFLQDDLDQGETEEVHVPDFAHILGLHDPGEDAFNIASNMRSRWKRKLYLLMEDPSSGREAFFIHVTVTGAILFSVALTTMLTLPVFNTNPASVKALFGLDTALVVLFTIEYIARSLAHSDSWSMYYNWVTSFFAILDLLSILPYYIELARQDDTSTLFRFSILRTFRLLRVFRAFRYQNRMLLTIEVMYVAVRRSKDALIAISYFIVLVLVLFSTLIYFAERGTWDPTLGAFVDSDGEVSPFSSIPETTWFCLVTMSTTGYGDVTPKTALGKVLAVPLLLFGLLLIALPSFVLGRNFAIVHDAMIASAKHITQRSPRDSVSEEGTPVHSSLTPIEEADSSSAPLLPLSARSTTPNGRDRSPAPGGAIHDGHPMQMPMWAGDASAGRSAPSRDPRDLTNTKLAKNQYVLLEQIEALRKTIDKQGEMLEVLTKALVEVKQDKGKGKAFEYDHDHGA